MAGEPRSFKVYYDHFLLEGKYLVYDEKNRKVREISIGHNDILVLDRIISFEKTVFRNPGGHPKKLSFYMTNEGIAAQLHMSYTTASNCISRLKLIGVIKTHVERPTNGRVAPKRYAYTQEERLKELVKIRKLDPDGVVDLVPHFGALPPSIPYSG